MRMGGGWTSTPPLATPLNISIFSSAYGRPVILDFQTTRHYLSPQLLSMLLSTICVILSRVCLSVIDCYERSFLRHWMRYKFLEIYVNFSTTLLYVTIITCCITSSSYQKPTIQTCSPWHANHPCTTSVILSHVCCSVTLRPIDCYERSFVW